MKKIFLIALFSPFLSFCQQTFVPGYIVQLNGDTVRGEIKINPKKEFDLFAKVGFKELSGMQRTYKADKIKSYTYEGKVFVAGTNDGEPVFFKTLSSGAIDLFEMRYEVLQMNDIKVKNEYYMRRNGSKEYVKIRHNHFKKQLVEQMADDENLIKELEESKDLEMENMVEVFNRYNTWAKTNKS